MCKIKFLPFPVCAQLHKFCLKSTASRSNRMQVLLCYSRDICTSMVMLHLQISACFYLQLSLYKYTDTHMAYSTQILCIYIHSWQIPMSIGIHMWQMLMYIIICTLTYRTNPVNSNNQDACKVWNPSMWPGSPCFTLLGHQYGIQLIGEGVK